MEQKPAMDVTVSGTPVPYYRLPGGGLRPFVGESGAAYDAWKAEPPRAFKLNALAVETFQKQTYPVVNVSIKEKDVSWFAKFWYKDWKDEKLYDVTITPVGEKTVTMVKTVSGSVFYFDEDVTAFENAINSAKGVTGHV